MLFCWSHTQSPTWNLLEKSRWWQSTILLCVTWASCKLWRMVVWIRNFWMLVHRSTRMKTRICEKWGISRRRMVWIVVREFNQVQKINQVDETTNIFLQSLVDTLTLYIGIWMIAWRNLEHVLRKLWDELWTTITNNIIWKTMMPEYLQHNYIDNFLTISRLSKWQVTCHFGRSINHSENCIKTFWNWEVSNEIQGYRPPRIFRNWKRL